MCKVIPEAKFLNIISCKVYSRSKRGGACLRVSLKVRRGDSLDVFAVSFKYLRAVLYKGRDSEMDTEREREREI